MISSVLWETDCYAEENVYHVKELFMKYVYRVKELFK
jgi:hypothetical protein